MSVNLINTLKASRTPADAAIAPEPSGMSDMPDENPAANPMHENFTKAMTHLNRAMNHAKDRGGAINVHLKLAKHHLAKMSPEGL